VEEPKRKKLLEAKAIKVQKNTSTTSTINYDDIPEGECNTMLLKNYIVVISRSLKIDPKDMNK
jgi:hypothetical protein